MLISGYDYISEDEFRNIWGAGTNLSGDLYAYPEIRSSPERLIWTVFEGEAEGDGNWYASPGIGFINALGYVKTSRPWDLGTADAIWYLND